MAYTEITPPPREDMRKASLPVIEDVKKRAGADLVNQVLAEAGQALKPMDKRAMEETLLLPPLAAASRWPLRVLPRSRPSPHRRAARRCRR
jgi:hypothetical protein